MNGLVRTNTSLRFTVYDLQWESRKGAKGASEREGREEVLFKETGTTLGFCMISTSREAKRDGLGGVKSYIMARDLIDHIQAPPVRRALVQK